MIGALDGHYTPAEAAIIEGVLREYNGAIPDKQPSPKPPWRSRFSGAAGAIWRGPTAWSLSFLRPADIYRDRD